jgi:hypothetical protein
VRCDTCHAEHLVAFSWPLLRIPALAALVIPFTSQAPRVTPGILPSALRASLRLFKIAPGDFVCPSCGARRMADECTDARGRAKQEPEPKARRCWWTRSCPNSRYGNGC